MNTYLEHHGILGMKWGVRRFQNEDGSYTTAGKQRRRNGGQLAGGKNKKNDLQVPDFRVETRKNHRSETLRKAQKKNINDMSNEELRRYNDRLQLEQNFERLREDNYSKAQTYITKTLTKVALTTAAAYALPKIAEIGSEWVKSMLNTNHYIQL